MTKNTQDMQGKLIIVGGASSGIGRAVAEEYISRGATVVVLARRAEKLAEIQGAIPCAVDLTAKTIDIRSAIERTLREAGISQPVDEIHNYAGVMSMRHPDEVDDEHSQRVWQVNALSGARLFTAVQNSSEIDLVPDAHIALCSSAIVEMGRMYGIEQYVDSKVFLEEFILKLRDRFPEMHITSVRPGLTRTEMATNGDAANHEMIAKMLMLFATEADECARAIVDDVQTGKDISCPTWDARYGHVVMEAMPKWLHRLVRGVASEMNRAALRASSEVTRQNAPAEPRTNRPWRSNGRRAA